MGRPVVLVVSLNVWGEGAEGNANKDKGWPGP